MKAKRESKATIKKCCSESKVPACGFNSPWEKNIGLVVFCLVLFPACVLVSFVGGFWWHSLAEQVSLPGWTAGRGSPCVLVWWFQCELYFFVTNGFGLSATWLGATASYKMASPAPGSYSAHLSLCPGCPANLEMFPALSKQDQMLLNTFRCTNCQPNQTWICLFQLTSICWVSEPLHRAEMAFGNMCM